MGMWTWPFPQKTLACLLDLKLERSILSKRGCTMSKNGYERAVVVLVYDKESYASRREGLTMSLTSFELSALRSRSLNLTIVCTEVQEPMA